MKVEIWKSINDAIDEGDEAARYFQKVLPSNLVAKNLTLVLVVVFRYNRYPTSQKNENPQSQSGTRLDQTYRASD